MNISRKVLFILILAVGAVGAASIPDHQEYVDLCVAPGLKPIEKPLFSRENIEAYVPVQLTPTTDREAFKAEFQAKLGQRALDRFFESDVFKKTPAGHAVEKFRAITENSLAIKTPGLAGHKPQELKFKLLAFERRAMISYSGYIDSKLVYFLDENSTEWDLTKPLGEYTQLTLMNTVSDVAFISHSNQVITSKLVFDYKF